MATLNTPTHDGLPEEALDRIALRGMRVAYSLRYSLRAQRHDELLPDEFWEWHDLESEYDEKHRQLRELEDAGAPDEAIFDAGSDVLDVERRLDEFTRAQDARDAERIREQQRNSTPPPAAPNIRMRVTARPRERRERRHVARSTSSCDSGDGESESAGHGCLAGEVLSHDQLAELAEVGGAR